MSYDYADTIALCPRCGSQNLELDDGTLPEVCSDCEDLDRLGPAPPLVGYVGLTNRG